MLIYETLNFLPQKNSKKRYGICEPILKQELLKYNNCTGIWLKELKNSTQVECLSAMQAKSVATTPESFEALSIRNAHISIRQIRAISAEIIFQIDNFIDLLPISLEDLIILKKSFSSICHKICEVIEICRRKGCDIDSNKIKCSVSVASLCKNIIKFMNCFIEKKNVNNAQLEATFRKLKETFGEMIDLTIRKECKVIISSIYNTKNHLSMKWCLLAYWQLTQNDVYISKIFIQDLNVIKRLMEIVTNYSIISLNDEQQVKAAALRVLSNLCINQEAINQIYKECITGKCFLSYICNESCEIILRESLNLMVQLTTPFITYNYDLANVNILDEFVQNLTEIASSTCSNEIFLLSSASLANISFVEVESIINRETIPILISACKRRTNVDDILLKDQIVTILANVARKYPNEIINSGGLVFLLCSLQLRPSNAHSHKDMVAIERIQQKIGVALARLGNDHYAGKLIYKLHGINRLIELCKNAKERHFSDIVLFVCLGALRRISHTVGKKPFIQFNALDLIELKFQQAFNLYTCKNESFV